MLRNRILYIVVLNLQEKLLGPAGQLNTLPFRQFFPRIKIHVGRRLYLLNIKRYTNNITSFYIPTNNWPVLQRTNTMAKKKPPKRPSLTLLKKKAPKIPDFTCVQIDNIIEKLEKLQSNEKHLTKSQLTRLRNSLEKLRSSNDRLRDSGIYWYEQLKRLVLKL